MMLDFCTGVLYCLNVQINRCKRCNRDWCFRGAGHALRCGKCGSPYWDREARNVGNAGIDRKAEKGISRGRGTRKSSVPVLQATEKPEKHVRTVHALRNELAAGGDASDVERETVSGSQSLSGEVGSCPHDPQHVRSQIYCRAINGGC